MPASQHLQNSYCLQRIQRTPMKHALHVFIKQISRTWRWLCNEAHLRPHLFTLRHSCSTADAFVHRFWSNSELHVAGSKLPSSLRRHAATTLHSVHADDTKLTPR